ncbi:thioredoxin domain-containing protein [Candidatus Falkowbacteria bacterium]|nr:thioredoxin domain-containing protein [Candidatus Falkowbacteria bacterium]
MKKTIFLILALSFVLTGCSAANLSSKFFKDGAKVLTPDEAKTVAADFINKNLLQKGSEATVKEVVLEGGLYKLTVKLPNGKEIISYITKDGKKFFPEAMDVKKEEGDAGKTTSDNKDRSVKVSAKKDKPEVELFVMSHCPYGTQIEKGILPVLEALGGKIDFKLKFVDYAMHGEKELKEELRQYCVGKNEPDKLLDYLKCFLKEGDDQSCVKETSVDTAKLNSCAAETDNQFKVMANFKDKSKWAGGSFPPFDIYKADNKKYGVQGSPTLIINGEQIQADRDSASLLAAICGGFNNKPAECDKQLSSAAPAAGFGEGSGSDSGGGCGN